MRFLLWRADAKPDSQPYAEIHRPETFRAGEDGSPIFVGDFRMPIGFGLSPTFDDWRPGIFRLCVDGASPGFIAVSWPETRERIAA